MLKVGMELDHFEAELKELLEVALRVNIFGVKGGARDDMLLCEGAKLTRTECREIFGHVGGLFGACSNGTNGDTVEAGGAFVGDEVINGAITVGVHIAETTGFVENSCNDVWRFVRGVGVGMDVNTH